MSVFFILMIVILFIAGGVGAYFAIKAIPPKPTEPPTTTSPMTPTPFAFPCSPTLAQVDGYAATYIKDKSGNCVPDTCKPGYNLYFSKDGSFKRCQ